MYVHREPYNFTVCWNDIKYIYVYITHRIQHNKLISFLFEIHVCSEMGKKFFVPRERENERKRVRMRIHTSLNSLLYISYHLGAFFSIAVLFQNKNGALFPFGLPAKCCCLGKLYSSSKKDEKGKRRKIGKKTFFFLSSCRT